MLYLATLAVFFAKPPSTSALLMMSNSLRHGVTRSLWTVAGDLSANSLQMTAAAFGLAALIAVSGEIMTWVKWAGVAYLIWMGISLIRSAPKAGGPDAAKAARASVLWRQGFLTSAANPYAIVFFGALFPQFIDPGAPIWPQIFILGGTYLLVDGVLLVIWGNVARQTLGRIQALDLGWINRISGGMLILAAALLASRDLSADTTQ
ncbi:MAG: LysE family translocator [Planctomycetota bacterium]